MPLMPAAVVTRETMPYAQLQHLVASGVEGGTATSGSWQTRTLNTELTDPNGIVTLTGSVFVLVAGSYEIDAAMLFWANGVTVTRLHNTTDDTTLLRGMSNRSGGSDFTSGPNLLRGLFTIAASKNLELQFWCEATKATNGQGFNFSAPGVDQIYADVILRKLS